MVQPVKAVVMVGWFWIVNDHYFQLKMGCGVGTNTIAKLFALWCLLIFVIMSDATETNKD